MFHTVPIGVPFHIAIIGTGIFSIAGSIVVAVVVIGGIDDRTPNIGDGGYGNLQCKPVQIQLTDIGQWIRGLGKNGNGFAVMSIMIRKQDVGGEKDDAQVRYVQIATTRDGYCVTKGIRLQRQSPLMNKALDNKQKYNIKKDSWDIKRNKIPPQTGACR